MARVTLNVPAVLAVATAASVDLRVVIAHEAADVARTTAPVESGEYRAGAGVRLEGDEVAIINSDPESHYKEYGTSDTVAHMTMTNAARQFGRYTGRTGRSR